MRRSPNQTSRAASSADAVAAASLAAGTHWLAGTNPSCTAIAGVDSFQCELGSAPIPFRSSGGPNSKLAAGQTDPTSGIAPGAFEGVTELTADAGHFNGGARALNADGSIWRVYLGEAAVQQGILSQRLLDSTPVRATTSGSDQPAPTGLDGGEG